MPMDMQQLESAEIDRGYYNLREDERQAEQRIMDDGMDDAWVWMDATFDRIHARRTSRLRLVDELLLAANDAKSTQDFPLANGIFAFLYTGFQDILTVVLETTAEMDDQEQEAEWKPTGRQRYYDLIVMRSTQCGQELNIPLPLTRLWNLNYRWLRQRIHSEERKFHDRTYDDHETDTFDNETDTLRAYVVGLISDEMSHLKDWDRSQMVKLKAFLALENGQDGNAHFRAEALVAIGL